VLMMMIEGLMLFLEERNIKNDQGMISVVLLKRG